MVKAVLLAGELLICAVAVHRGRFSVACTGAHAAGLCTKRCLASGPSDFSFAEGVFLFQVAFLYARPPPSPHPPRSQSWVKVGRQS